MFGQRSCAQRLLVAGVGCREAVREIGARQARARGARDGGRVHALQDSRRARRAALADRSVTARPGELLCIGVPSVPIDAGLAPKYR